MELKQEKSNGYGVGVLTGILATALVFCGAWTGKILYDNSRAKTASVSGASEEESVVNSETISKMAAIEAMVNERFYFGDVEEEDFQKGICNGMIEALDDKYAAYYTAEELNTQIQSNKGVYYGVGAYVTMDEETQTPYISGVIEGTPAQEAGLRMGDIIYAVDGTATFQMTLDDVTGLIKGEEGTCVTLTLIRDGEAFDQDVVRRRVDRPTVTSRMLDEEIGYIGISEFKDVTVDQFTENYAVIKGSGAKALVLDLRGNPGGSLNAVVEMARMILPKGMIVYTEDKNGKRSEYACDGSRKLKVPLVVLIDMNSASASEIMAGAIKDYELGTLVGTTTFGKGIVQQIIPFRDGSAVKVTISAYYTPKGNNIHGIGVEPDVVCEFDGEAYYSSEDHPDNQLEKAKEVLREMME